MTKTEEATVTVRGLLWTNWGAGVTPSKATIGDKGFVVVNRKELMTTSPVVTVAEESESSNTIAGGSASPVLNRAVLRVGAWTTSKQYLADMILEIERIIESVKDVPGGGLHHLQKLGALPRTDSKMQKEMVAKEVRVLVVYWQ